VDAERWDERQAEKQQQVEALNKQIERQMEPVLQKADADLQSLYRAHPELAPSSEQIVADKLSDEAARIQAEADELELAGVRRMISERMRARLPLLIKCEQEIGAKIGEK
jgi:hypothetical protein